VGEGEGIAVSVEVAGVEVPRGISAQADKIASSRKRERKRVMVPSWLGLYIKVFPPRACGSGIRV